MLIACARDDHRSAPVLFERVPTEIVERVSPAHSQGGLDFHCMPHIVDNLARATGLTEDQVKAAIWEASSKTNARVASTVDPEIRVRLRGLAPHLARARAQRRARMFEGVPGCCG